MVVLKGERRRCKLASCNRYLPVDARKDKEYCNSSCRATAWKERRFVTKESLLIRIGKLEKRVEALEKKAPPEKGE